MKNIFDKLAYLGSIFVGGWVIGFTAGLVILASWWALSKLLAKRQTSTSDDLDKELERLLNESSRPQ